MKILVTGANGFIGGNIIKELFKNEKYDIFATSFSQKYSGSEDVKYISANLSEDSFIECINKKIKQCDVIVHSGALINYDIFSKEEIMTNCFGVQQIIKLAYVLKCKKVIFTSGSTVIGKPICIPVTEEHPANPRTIYLASKFFGENLLLTNSGLDIKPIILRITSPIGPNISNKRMLSIFIDNIINGKEIVIWGKGIRRQNYVDVRDIANSIELACNKDVEGVFNIGGCQSYTSIELADECQRVLNKKVNLIFKDVELEDEYYNWEVSIEKAKKQLGYYPKYSLEETIKDIVKYKYNLKK